MNGLLFARYNPRRRRTGVMCEEVAGKVTGNAQKVIYCEEARRLLEAFGEAVHELIKLHETQFLAIVEGDSNAGRFDLLAHDALERKQNAKYAYLEHLEAHGCSQTETHHS
jgi:hypothetical protein